MTQAPLGQHALCWECWYLQKKCHGEKSLVWKTRIQISAMMSLRNSQDPWKSEEATLRNYKELIEGGISKEVRGKAGVQRGWSSKKSSWKTKETTLRLAPNQISLFYVHRQTGVWGMQRSEYEGEGEEEGLCMGLRHCRIYPAETLMLHFRSCSELFHLSSSP